MNSRNLDNLKEMGKIKKEEFNADFIIGRCELASKRIENAKLLLKNNNYDESVFISAYSELYSSFRILCEVMLAMCGYRAEKGSGHHGLIISTIWLTLEDEEMNPVYSRLKKIGGKRNEMEYGGNFDISTIEIKTMLEDVELVLKKVRSEIKIKKSA
ncbi:MAG: hypothetical protein A3J65_01340 [Candidatus Buchananbacteria bacterium RIFCSPHIGHO2_02_FULL_45_11b]|uniref:HEPN domain-containing protein n=2 Tax=Candidatus Buchananiibacteriota TaxID=1817903 RepID=A0A1G1YCM6_9BACT|nr:MAG: hypothetical protein A3J65_01340 [Candidatus Buchananbacteria bacterium RIFCSPHIGHO2_02_FULL_45_11b]OGY56655.1 MAG: hypothetical protein A3H67_00445 [Candidatus Buchananbacteria bacterium RIFCSPLOWO2_02_FULL_46_11b]